MGVIIVDKGFSGRLEWQHFKGNDYLEIYSPLGGKVASIKKTQQKVTLTEKNGKVTEAQNVETLTETTLGWHLPLEGLSYWVLGKPSNSKIDYAIWDQFGRLIELKQNGWDIKYSKYTDNKGYSLPNRIALRNEKIRLKLLIEQWADVSGKPALVNTKE